MATGSFLEEFCQEITCTNCLEYFNDPITIDCGHNFCQACLTKICDKSNAGIPCPQCKETIPQRNFKRNQQLANVVELVKKLWVSKTGEIKGRVCESHQEPLKLFCKDDDASICVVCSLSKAHRDHNVFPIEEITQEFKEEIDLYLQLLKNGRENLECHKLAEELKLEDYRKILELEDKRVKLVFESIQTFLEEKRQCWIFTLEELVKTIEKNAEGNISGLSEDISQLSQHITDIEKMITEVEMSQLPGSKWLEEVKRTLSRYEKKFAKCKVDTSLNMEDSVREMSVKNSLLEKVVDNFKEYFDQVLNKTSLAQAVKTVSITLDPLTAHPYLTLADNLKMVTWEPKKKKREVRKRNMLNNADRFDWEPCVLGNEKFTSGLQGWVMQIFGVGSWMMGVARDSVNRKGSLQFNPKEGFWALRREFQDTHLSCKIVALTLPEPTPLMMKEEPARLLIVLDYDRGLVSFSDADTKRLLFTFHEGSFSGESIRPFLQLREWGFSLMCVM